MNIDPTNLAEVLRWLAAGGASVVASFLLSEVAENHWPGFHSFKPWVKAGIMLVGSLLIALGAHAAVTRIPAETLVALQPWFRVAVVTLLASLSTQFWHRVIQVKTLKLGLNPEDFATLRPEDEAD